MNGIDALRLLSRRRTDQVVITTMSTIKDWEAVSTAPHLDAEIIRPMGKCGDMGLGIALARPDVGVWVLDGDGSLLMNMGCLVTIAHMAPPNLLYVVYENGTYDTTGGQPVPGAGMVDYVAFARGAGIATCAGFDNLEDLDAGLDALLQSPGPIFLDLRVAHAPRRPFPDLYKTEPSLENIRRQLAARKPPR